MRLMPFSAALIATVLVAACATDAPGPTSAQREQALTAQATVVSIDQQSRQVLLRDAGGDILSFIAGPEVRNLAQVETGDIVTIAYFEAIAVALADPADPGGALTGVEADRAPLGARPGGETAVVTEAMVIFESYDAETAIATFTAPDGTLRAIRVHPDMQAFAAARSPGERIAVSIAEAVAISVDPA